MCSCVCVRVCACVCVRVRVCLCVANKSHLFACTCCTTVSVGTPPSYPATAAAARTRSTSRCTGGRGGWCSSADWRTIRWPSRRTTPRRTDGQAFQLSIERRGEQRRIHEGSWGRRRENERGEFRRRTEEWSVVDRLRVVALGDSRGRAAEATFDHQSSGPSRKGCASMLSNQHTPFYRRPTPFCRQSTPIGRQPTTFHRQPTPLYRPAPGTNTLQSLLSWVVRTFVSLY